MLKKNFLFLLLLLISVLSFSGCFEQTAQSSSSNSSPSTRYYPDSVTTKKVSNNGTHRSICPHLAVQALRAYQSSYLTYVTRRGIAVSKGGNWTFLKSDVMPVAGFSKISGTDYKHPNDTLFVLAADSTSVKPTFIAYEHGDIKGTPLFPVSSLVDEWAMNGYRFYLPSEMFKQMRNRSFALLEVSEEVINNKDLVGTNTIFIDSRDMPRGDDFTSFKKINELFLANMPVGDRASFDTAKILFIVASKNSSGEDLVVIYELNASNEFLVGRGFAIDNGNPNSKERFVAYLESKMKSMGSGGRVYHYGSKVDALINFEANPFSRKIISENKKKNSRKSDEAKFQIRRQFKQPTLNKKEETFSKSEIGSKKTDAYSKPVSSPKVEYSPQTPRKDGTDIPKSSIGELAEKFGIEIIRRGSNSEKTRFLLIDEKLRNISGIQMSKENTVFFDGIPTFENPKSSNELKWSNHKKEITTILNDKTQKVISTKQELFDEFVSGSSDVLLLMARKNGDSIEFGNEKVTAEEIEALASRTDVNERKKARILLMVVCDIGFLSEDIPQSIFFKNISFPEILIEKGFFDVVIAPSHKVLLDEATAFVQEYTSRDYLFKNGWTPTASNHFNKNGKQIIYRKEIKDGQVIQLFFRS